MRILVFGAGGMLGHKAIQAFSPDCDVWGTVRGGFEDISRYGFLNRSRSIEAVDITEEAAIRRAVEAAKPDVAINAIGIVKQQPLSKNVIATLAVNSIFPHRLSQWRFRRQRRTARPPPEQRHCSVEQLPQPLRHTSPLSLRTS